MEDIYFVFEKLDVYQKTFICCLNIFPHMKSILYVIKLDDLQSLYHLI